MPNPLVRKLEQFGRFSEEEKRVLEDAASRIRQFSRHEDMAHEGDRPLDCTLILEGFACRYKVLANGRRQIMAFEIPGDICDLSGFLLGELDHSIGTLTPCKVAPIPHKTIIGWTERQPRIARALWRSTMIDSAIFRMWMVNIGRRSAYQRIAHLICETLVRLETVGLAQERSFELPVTQTELGDALGLSTVHCNRILQRLRREGLITLGGGDVSILDWEALKRAADFGPTYLHFGKGIEEAQGLTAHD